MYKVIFKTKNGATVTAYIDDIHTAYEFAVSMDGYILHAKGARQ